MKSDHYNFFQMYDIPHLLNCILKFIVFLGERILPKFGPFLAIEVTNANGQGLNSVRQGYEKSGHKKIYIFLVILIFYGAF